MLTKDQIDEFWRKMNMETKTIFEIAEAYSDKEVDKRGRITFDFDDIGLIYFACAVAEKEREECAKLAEGWESESGEYMTCGNGNYWDAGNVYDQARSDAAFAIRARGTK